MSVVVRNGEFVNVPGEDVVLDELAPAVKMQLWTGIKNADPKRAQSMIDRKKDPTYQALQETFGAREIITTPEFNYFMKEGAKCLTPKR